MKKLGKNIQRALTGVSVAAAAFALSVTPAFAGSNLHLQAYSEECTLGTSCIVIEHADGYFYYNGDSWKVCDNYPDGDRAVLHLFWSDSSGSWTRTIQDTNGSGNSCATGSKNIDEGTTVYVSVWHQNGAGGTAKDVRNGTGKA
ncbi:hypothetical protein AB8A21_32515 [Streptomyces sp. BF23-18]|uniref:hypothetical protein n=1 Tax=Streptomyces sp. BF23-18 TaxID=3240282 RepID=UPI0034E3A0C6